MILDASVKIAFNKLKGSVKKHPYWFRNTKMKRKVLTEINNMYWNLVYKQV